MGVLETRQKNGFKRKPQCIDTPNKNGHQRNSLRIQFIIFVSEVKTKHNNKCIDAVHVHFFWSHRIINDANMSKSMKKLSIKTFRVYDFMVHQVGGYEFMGFTIKDLYNKLD